MREHFDGKRVLVTGGSGFIGSHLCRRLTEYGATVTVMDKRSLSSILDSADVMCEVAASDMVYHLAAQTEVGRGHNSPWDTYHTNVMGTLNVLEGCRKHGKPLVVASSDKAYGKRPTWEMPYKESMTLLGNADSYSNSKRIADDLCHHYAETYHMRLRVLRCANVYGPGQTNQTTLITNTITRLLRGEPPQVHEGAKDIVREWLYVDDAVEAYLLAMTNTAYQSFSGIEKGKFAFNVGSGDVMSVIDMVDLLRRLVDADEVNFHKTIQTPCEEQITYQCLDSSRFTNTFKSFKPTPIREGLARTILWMRAQR